MDYHELPTKGSRWRGGYINKIRVGSYWNIMTIFGHVRYICSYFYFFHPKNKIIHSVRCWPKSFKFCRSITSVWQRQLCPNLGGRVLRDENRKNCSSWSQSIKSLTLYDIPRNQLSGSIRRWDVGIVFFMTMKKDCSFSISHRLSYMWPYCTYTLFPDFRKQTGELKKIQKVSI